MKQRTKVVIGSSFGTFMEYYDFFLYGLMAALVFDKIFFPNYEGATGTLLALGTFAVAYVARPLGSIIFSHIGDRSGRKVALFLTLAMMGSATFLIGLLPTYSNIGVIAPVLLIVLRVLQGISAGGESGGAYLMSVEHAGEKRASLMGSWVMATTPFAFVGANLTVLLTTLLPGDAFLAWGWRIPFLFSGVLVVIGMVVRSRLEESPSFTTEQKRGELLRLPIAYLFKNHRSSFIVAVLLPLSLTTTITLVQLFSISYGTKVAEFSQREALNLILIMMIVAAFGTPLWGVLGDRVGPRKLLMAGVPLFFIAASMWLWALQSHSFGIAVIGFVLIGTVYGTTAAVQPALLAALFPARVRYTGVAVTSSLTTLIGAAPAPILATYLVTMFNSLLPVLFYVAVASVLSLLAATVYPRLTSHSTQGSSDLADPGSDAVEGVPSRA